MLGQLLEHYVLLASVIFTIGAVGFLVRSNILVQLMSIELMLNAVNLTFLAFSRFPLVPNSPMGSFLAGHAAVFFVIATAAAEAAVGLAIIIAVFRSRTSVNVDEFDTLKL
jgi:NADH-quinone oxidoreductase subunit K